MLFLQNYAIKPAPRNKSCISLRVFLFLFCRVSLAVYLKLMLLLENVNYASNVFETYVIVTILKLCCLAIIFVNLATYYYL